MFIEQLYDSNYAARRENPSRPGPSPVYRRSVEDFTGLWQFMRIASSMEPIGLDGLQEVALMNRRETKYVLKEHDLLNALSTLTSRYRVQAPQFLTDLSSEFDEFVQDHFPLSVDELEPKLLNAYRRITLVGKHNPERVTLDLGPRFYADGGNETLPGIVIAEVKYENNGRDSDFMRRMREMGIRPMGFRKYCIGISMLYPQVKNQPFQTNTTHSS